MTAPEKYDAIVIGRARRRAPLSQALAGAGRSTALIEREHVGGTCINEGCTPTKTMVASGRVAYLARRAADYGVHTGPIAVDMERVRQRKRDIVESFRGGSERRIAQTPNLTLLFGAARFTGPKTVEVRLRTAATRAFSADRIVINAGGRPACRRSTASTACRGSTRPRSWSWTSCRSTCWWSAAATSGSSSARCSAASAAGSRSCSAARSCCRARTPTSAARWRADPAPGRPRAAAWTRP